MSIMLGQVICCMRHTLTHVGSPSIPTTMHHHPTCTHTPTQVEQAMAEPEDMREATCFQKSFIVLRACFYFTVSKQTNKQNRFT